MLVWTLVSLSINVSSWPFSPVKLIPNGSDSRTMISSDSLIWSPERSILPVFVSNVIIGPSVSFEGGPKTNLRLDTAPIATELFPSLTLNLIFEGLSENFISLGTRNWGEIVLLE